ncbi:hypothetical protein [Micromonospora sp. LOL_023]|uniref:hypothetical protein n=1 Tax=Micromonospora sp. LOL_023 TaxID=3345418 RepID=UPI003A8B6199
MFPHSTRQQASQARQDRPVRPRQLRPAGNLPAEHRYLMLQREDLDQQRFVAADQQPQPVEQPDHPQVQQPHDIPTIINPSRELPAHSMCDELWHGTA